MIFYNFYIKGGHLLPGSFFLLFSIWWSFITAIRYVQSKLRSPYKKNATVGYKSTAWMPCLCLPCGPLKRGPVESYLKFFLALVGLLGEIITGLSIRYKPISSLSKTLTTDSIMSDGEHHEHNHVHKRDASLPNETMISYWHMDYANAQHVTMYSGFMLGALVEILMYHRFDLPAKLDYACGILGFAIEAFLFVNHLHSKEPLEVHVHVLLVYAVYGCIIFCVLEYVNPKEIMYTYGRILFTMLHGTWFFEVGFVLYPPTDDPAYQWDKNDHNQIMTITVSYAWHVILIATGLLIQLGIIKRVYKGSKRMAAIMDQLIMIDDMNSYVSQPVKDVKDYDASETKFLNLHTDDSGDERIEFDTTSLIRPS